MSQQYCSQRPACDNDVWCLYYSILQYYSTCTAERVSHATLASNPHSSSSHTRHHLEGLVAPRSALQAVCNPLLFVQGSSVLLLCNLSKLLSGLTKLPLLAGIDTLQLTQALHCAALSSLHHQVELRIELAQRKAKQSWASKWPTL